VSIDLFLAQMIMEERVKGALRGRGDDILVTKTHNGLGASGSGADAADANCLV
jgi:hypothetical protein